MDLIGKYESGAVIVKTYEIGMPYMIKIVREDGNVQTLFLKNDEFGELCDCISYIKAGLPAKSSDALVPYLNDSSRRIFQQNKAKGFWDDDRNIGELLMLITSELAEALEADRKFKSAKLHHFYQALTNDNFIEVFSKHIKDTFEDEIADAVIRLLDLCGGLGIDIETHINLKLQYNQSRGQKHGKKY